jgi:two-component system, OmpR family, sensor histidine kinase KdpD
MGVPEARSERHASRMRQVKRLAPLAGSVAAVALVTGAVALLDSGVPVLSLGVLYVFAVLPVAVLWGRAYAIGVAVASMLAFNFFFLPPQHTFQLRERSNWLALVVYLATAAVVSELATRSRRRAAEAEQRELEEALLGELSVALLQGEHLTAELERIGAAVAQVFHAESARVVLGVESEGGLELTAGDRVVGALVLPAGSHADPATVRRFLPALASLLAVGLDREELEREALAAERLRMSDAVKTAILRAVSHDLRSPLTAIRVAAESLASPSVRLSEEDRLRQLETVRTESRRLDRLVSNLLDFSRLEAGGATPRQELVALDELVGQALGAIESDGVPVRVRLPEEVPLVEVDAAQVERVLVNLLANSLRFAPVDSGVTVVVDVEGDEAVLRIANRGPAIARDDLERIFEPFIRLEGGTDREGTGLGLAIARGFAEANGGRVWAEAPPEGGVVFAVGFPLAAAPLGAER